MVSVGAGRHWQFGTTADVGIAATAPAVEALFDKMGRALFSVMTDLSAVRPTATKMFEVAADTPEGLLVAFLSELVYLHDTGDWVFSSFDVEVTWEPRPQLRATAHGEAWDEGRHPRHTEVKAVTLHRAEFDRKALRAQVVLDI